MKRTVFLLCLFILLGFSAKSQIDSFEVTQHKGRYRDLYVGDHNQIEVVDNNLCELFFSGSNVSVIFYDKNTLEYKKTKKFSLRVKRDGDEKKKKHDFSTLVVLKSSVVILSKRHGKKNMVEFYAQQYDFDFEPKGEPVLIAEEDNAEYDIINAIVSDDKESFSFSTIIDEYSIGSYLVTENLKLVAQTHQKGKENLDAHTYNYFPRPFTTSIVNNTCLVSVLYCEADEHKNGVYKIGLTDGTGTTFLDWGEKGVGYGCPRIIGSENGIVKISGLYYADETKYDGVATALVNTITKQITQTTHSEFTTGNLNKKNTYSDVNLPVKNSYIIGVFVKENGDYVIAGETGYAATYTSYSQNGASSYTIDHHENVMIVVVDKDGNIKMHGKIARESWYEPFLMSKDLKEPVVVYLDNRENYNNGMPEEKPTKHLFGTSAKKIVGVLYSIGDDTINLPSVFYDGSKNKKYMPILNKHIVLNENEIIFYSHKGNFKFTLYKIKFYWSK